MPRLRHLLVLATIVAAQAACAGPRPGATGMQPTASATQPTASIGPSPATTATIAPQPSAVESSIAAGCPTTFDGLAEAVAPFADLDIQVGSVDVPFVVYGWIGRWNLLNSSTNMPQFAPWDRELVLHAGPGEPLVVAESVEDLELESIHATTYRRDDVDAFLAGTRDIVEIDDGSADAGPPGTAKFTVPLEPGSYVIDLHGIWLTACLHLDSTHVMSVEVR